MQANLTFSLTASFPLSHDSTPVFLLCAPHLDAPSRASIWPTLAASVVDLLAPIPRNYLCAAVSVTYAISPPKQLLVAVVSSTRTGVWVVGTTAYYSRYLPPGLSNSHDQPQHFEQNDRLLHKVLTNMSVDVPLPH